MPTSRARPEDDLDEAHANLAGGLRAFAGGLESLEEQPVGGDPAVVLPSVDGLEQIRAALLELRAAGIASSAPPGSAPLGLLAASVVYKVSI